jgi:nucleoside-diphosphate-sugar epimerase
MKVLVTGGSGLIGRHTVAALLDQGREVRTFQRGSLGAARGERIEEFRGDIRVDRRALCEAAKDCQAVVHLAGKGDVAESRTEPRSYAELIAQGTLNALEAARTADAVFVLASSQRVYALQPELCKEEDEPKPDSPYGYAKWIAELWCRMASEQFKTTTRVLRFFSVYGPGQEPNGGSGVVTIFARAALRDQPIHILSRGRRDFTDVRDVARGITLAIDKPPDGKRSIFNVATGTGTTFRALAEMIIKQTGSRSTIEDRITEPAGRDLVADIAKATRNLGYVPCVTLSEGLDHYLQWLQQHASA